MSELLNCPFCGSGADYVGGEGDGYIVECTKCRAKAGWGEYGYQAAAKWNTRPAPSEAEVEAVQVLDLLRTGKDGRKFDCIESRAGALVNVARFFGEAT